MKLGVTALATADLVSATQFYEVDPHLGTRFQAAVEAKLEQVLAFPKSVEIVHRPSYRRAKGSRKNNSPFSTAGLERVVPGGQGFELLQRQRVHVCRRDLDALHIGSANQVSTNSESG